MSPELLDPRAQRQGAEELPAGARWDRRALAPRRRAARRAARERIAARTVRPLPAELRVIDLSGIRTIPVARLLRAGSSLLLSAVLHGVLVGVAFAAQGGDVQRRSPPITLEVRPRPAPPPRELLAPAQPKAAVTPKPPPLMRERAAPPRRRIPPPAPPPETPPMPASSPPRVVGLSLESTAVGGDGPAFAVGNSREGETAARAVDPGRGVAGGPRPAPAAPSRNRVASQLPSAGVSYVLPERRRPSVPPYPEALKHQGIEADVTVMVRLDATGAVIAVEIARSSGHAELDRAACLAAQAESFAPARRNGVAIPYSFRFTYRFRLEAP